MKPQTQDLRLDQIRPRTYRQTKTNDCIRQKTPDKRQLQTLEQTFDITKLKERPKRPDCQQDPRRNQRQDEGTQDKQFKTEYTYTTNNERPRPRT